LTAPSVCPKGQTAPSEEGALGAGDGERGLCCQRGNAAPTGCWAATGTLSPFGAGYTPVVQSSYSPLPWSVLVSLPTCGSLTPSAPGALRTRFPPVPTEEGACGGGCCREGSAFLCVGCSRNPPGGYAATPLWQGRAAEVGVAGRGLLTRWFGALARVSSRPQPHGARNAAGGDRRPTACGRAEGRPPARTGPQASGGGRGGTLPR